MKQITALPPDRYGVVGFPIEHSKSPLIHRMFAEATGESLIYERHAVPPEEFVPRLHDFFASGVRGLNVTVPHKENAARFADVLTPRAAQAGAVNTLARLDDGRILGDNTDGAGLLADLDRLGVTVTGKRVLILGAGGATRGILAPLLARAPAVLLIANRTAERAQSLAADFAATLGVVTTTHSVIPAASPSILEGCSYAALETRFAAEASPETADAAAFDLILHATPLGLEGKVPEVTPRIIGPQTFAYDLGYAPTDTPFLLFAKAHGARGSAQGIGMLVEQAAEAFFVWRNVRPDTEPVHRALGGSAERGGSTIQSVSSERENKP